jgi:hypothetical protein
MRTSFFQQKENKFDTEVARTCKNCGHMFTDRFCNHCGEKVIEPHERSVTFFVGSVINAFTFLEGKFLNTLFAILYKPGQYSRHFADGIRQRYMKPVAFFFVANVIYFLFPLFQTFNTTLYAQTNQQFYDRYTAPIAERKMKELNITWDQLNEKYQPESTNWAKTLIVLMAPLMALFYALFHLSNRWFFSDHLLMSFECFSFFLFALNIIFPFFLYIAMTIGGWFGTDLHTVFQDSFTSPTSIGFMLYYFYKSEIAFYARNKWQAVVTALLLVFATILVIALYRFFLFHLTMWGI